MSKPFTTPPPTPPSTQGTRILKSVQDLIAREAKTPDEHVQKVVDLMHIETAIFSALSPLMAEAVDEGGATYRGLHTKTGLAKSGVQRRIAAGRTERGSARNAEAG
jgi:hypothetical protein